MRRRFTGTLRVDRTGTVKVIYFSQGDLACASSNSEEDRLGNLLVRLGRLSAEQLEHAKTRQSPRASIGNTLVELGYITAAELLEGARRQVEEIVTDLMGWREGTYQVRATPLSREVVNLALPARSLVVRALQQIQDRELVVERLGSMEAVLARVEPFDEAARALDFGFPAEPLLAALDGQRTVREACDAVDMEDFQASKVLYTLLAFGLLRRVPPGPGGAPARELVFVEGELLNGEALPRANETRPRWSLRRGARGRPAAPPAAAPAAPIPVADASEEDAAPAGDPAGQEPASGDGEVASIPVAAEAPAAAGEEAPAAFAATEEIELNIEEEPAGPPERPRRFRPGRSLWTAVLGLALLALLGGILYFAYFRPTLGPDDAEEARLLEALMDEAREEPEAPHPVPPAAAPPSDSTQAPRREPPPLEKRRPPTMLSADANFRSAIELMRDGRFPEAAESFRRALDSQSPDSYTIQVLLACKPSTLERAFERAPDRTLYFVSTPFRGQTCYRLLDGLYAGEPEARRELERVPAFFREEGNRPAVVRAPRR